MRLRGRVGELTRQLANYQAAASSRRNGAGAGANDSGLMLTSDALQDAGAATPEAAIQTMLWAATLKNGGRFAELLDTEALRSRAFVELRRASPNISVTEAEHSAAEAVESLKAVLAAGNAAFWSFPGDVAYWSVSDNKLQDDFIPGV